MSDIEVIGTNSWGKTVFEFSVETNDDGNGATFSNDDGMFIHTDFEPKLSFEGYEIPLDRLRQLASAEREGRVYVSQYPNCGMCKRVTIDMFATIEPCKSCRDRAMAEAALAGKGE